MEAWKSYRYPSNRVMHAGPDFISFLFVILFLFFLVLLMMYVIFGLFFFFKPLGLLI